MVGLENRVIVNFFGEDVSVPAWAEYVALNLDGDLIAFDEKPKIYMGQYISCGERFDRVPGVNVGEVFSEFRRDIVLKTLMKVERFDKMEKTVYYFGSEMKVPDWTEYIAVDPDGSLKCFKEKPSYDGNHWVGSDYEITHWINMDEFVFSTGLDVSETCVKVTDEKRLKIVFDKIGKSVLYYGNRFNVFDEAKYLTIDFDGNVHAHDDRPKICGKKWVSQGKSQIVAKVNLWESKFDSGFCWENSIRKI